MLIDSQHPSRAFIPKIKAFCDSILKPKGITHFQYLRCYPDGSYELMLPDPQYTEDVFDYEMPILSYCPQSYRQHHQYTFLWDKTLPSYAVDLVRRRYNIYHGITLTLRYPHHYDMIAFGLGNWVRDSESFYLNHANFLQDAWHHFTTKYETIIKISQQHRIHPPQHMQDVNRKEMCLKAPPRRYTVPPRTGEALSYLTHQESRCLYALKQYRTYKEAAQALNIGERTLETYVQRIRQRTGYSLLSDLLGLLLYIP